MKKSIVKVWSVHKKVVPLHSLLKKEPCLQEKKKCSLTYCDTNNKAAILTDCTSKKIRRFITEVITMNSDMGGYAWDRQTINQPLCINLLFIRYFMHKDILFRMESLILAQDER